MTFGEWQNEVSKLDNGELREFHDAMQTLKHWPAFQREFKDIGFFSLLVMVELELTKREISGEIPAKG